MDGLCFSLYPIILAINLIFKTSFAYIFPCLFTLLHLLPTPIPDTEKWIKPGTYRTYRQKMGLFRISERDKTGNELLIFKYISTERTPCIDTCKINYVYQKMELQDKIIYLWEKGIIIFGTQLIFGRSNDVCYIYIHIFTYFISIWLDNSKDTGQINAKYNNASYGTIIRHK